MAGVETIFSASLCWIEASISRFISLRLGSAGGWHNKTAMLKRSAATTPIADNIFPLMLTGTHDFPSSFFGLRDCDPSSRSMR
jgi:hypothetical protein